MLCIVRIAKHGGTIHSPKGTTINDLGDGPEESEKKRISEALLQEKINLKRPSPGKNKSQKALLRKK